jgi:transcriptional regulator with XRE-family HTH domain
MITNERQYAITRAAAARFAQSLDELDQRTELSPAQRDLERSGIQAQLDDLRGELAQFEAFRDGRVREVPIRSLLDVPRALIRARVAAGLTQKQLAKRLGIREQQVQQDEATQYAGAGLQRLHAIAAVLGVAFRGAADLPERGTLPTIPSQAELLGEVDEQRPAATAARAG